jgi:hypothetical protein
MATIHDLSGGLQALEIKGRGVIVVSKSSLLLIHDVQVVEGELVVVDVSYPAAAHPVKPGPSSIAAVNVTAFMDETRRRNLTGGGEYGAVGPLLAKLREKLKVCADDSPFASLIGNLLAMGDHSKYNSVAAVIEMPAALQAEFSQLLDGDDSEALEAFVDKAIVMAA